MAEYIARQHLGKNFFVQSAGIEFDEESHAALNAIEVMKENGFDITKHSPKGISNVNAHEYDYVIAITPCIAELLLDQYNVENSRLITLDIVDPYGSSITAYRQCYRKIDQDIKIITSKILNKS